jgi:hypothetical protein
MQAQQDDLLSAREEVSLHSHNTTRSQQKFDLSTNISFLYPQLPTDTMYVSFGQVLRIISFVFVRLNVDRFRKPPQNTKHALNTRTDVQVHV